MSTVSTVSNTVTLSLLPKSGLKGTAKKIYAIVGTELLNRGVLDTLGLDLVIAYCREMGLYNDVIPGLPGIPHRSAYPFYRIGTCSKGEDIIKN
ncbi:MAG: hypothetical protein PUC53_07270 [Bacteroidales bacterium]|nr:hypothetical protein [Bacteroidales bacterium]